MNDISTAQQPIIQVRGLTKAFEGGRIPALSSVDMDIHRGEFVALVGPSGCGKSTLLHLIAALDKPDAGTITAAGRDITGEADLNRFRAHDIGIIFQLHNLLPSLNAVENVQVPMFALGISSGERRRRAEHLLGLVGLVGKSEQLPSDLSGGERQRVAIARALANDPAILLADEPTGSLDSAAGQRILALIAELRAQRDLTILMVTHDSNVADHADRIVHMLDGRVLSEVTTKTPGLSSQSLQAAVDSGSASAARISERAQVTAAARVP